MAISELWLRDGAAEPLLPAVPTSIDECRRPREKFDLRLFADDPVGKRVEPGQSYAPTAPVTTTTCSSNPKLSKLAMSKSMNR